MNNTPSNIPNPPISSTPKSVSFSYWQPPQPNTFAPYPPPTLFSKEYSQLNISQSQVPPISSNPFLQTVNSQPIYGPYIPQDQQLGPNSSLYPPTFPNYQPQAISANVNKPLMVPSSPPISASFQNNGLNPLQPNGLTQQSQQFYNSYLNQQNKTIYYQPSPFGGINRLSGVQKPVIRLLRQKEPGKKVVALIVTFSSGASYDQLFTHVQQKTLEGTQVLVYACSSDSIGILIKALNGEHLSESEKADESGKKSLEIASHVKQVDPDCVVFNWECSSGYLDQHFPQMPQKLMAFLKLIIGKGFMAMFSDFSLKALINSWNQTILGKNPFKRTGAITGATTLKFKPSVLKQCPSSQLQLLGDLVEGGRCNINCASNTILYTVDKQSIDTRYILQVLTIRVIPNCSLPQAYIHEIDGELGDAGHVLIRYPTGGMILTSMGHWIELMKIDPSEKKLFEVAQREFGVQYAQQMQNEYKMLGSSTAKAQYLSYNASNFVQNQAPCQNMNRKAYN